jgi:outer membrane autotransporter protein
VTVAGADQLHAEFNANAFSGRVESGYRFVTPFAGGVGITPYAAGQFTTFDLPSYAEAALSGASTFALAYNARSVTDTRSELGIRTDKSFVVQGGIFTLRSRFAWAHDYDPDRSIAATFQSLPGASFVVNGAAQAADSALTTASAEMKWSNGWSVSGTFEGEFSASPTPTPARAWCATPGSKHCYRHGLGRSLRAAARCCGGRCGRLQHRDLTGAEIDHEGG